jgi:uncharacterized Zn-binding protein involved in type VI secretion
MGKPAARVSDMHICPMVSPGPTPHVGGPVLPAGCPTVIISGMPAARVGDKAVCNGPSDTIVSGAPCVIIGGMPAARLGDFTSHGGTITSGSPTVIIGDDCSSASSPQQSQSPSAPIGPCDEKVQITNTATGLPIKGYPFFVERDGLPVVSGRTDNQGCIPRIKSDRPEQYRLFLGDEALAKIEGKQDA